MHYCIHISEVFVQNSAMFCKIEEKRKRRGIFFIFCSVKWELYRCRVQGWLSSHTLVITTAFIIQDHGSPQTAAF